MTALNLRDTARLLGGDMVARNKIRCPGPGHSRHDRSLAVTFNGDSFLCHSFAGDDWRDCRDHVSETLGLDGRPPRPDNDNHPQVNTSALFDVKRRIENGMRIWQESTPLPGTMAETYLASRGLVYDGDALRFHPACAFKGERHPAMIGLMTDIVTGEPRGVHRTALLPDGGGKALPGKMMLGAAKVAVVRLTADDGVSTGLALAEGVETALAGGEAPVWECLSAGTLREFPVLAGIEALTIFADHDTAGIDAANACGERWHAAGREVTIVYSSVPGADLADEVA